MIDKLVCFTSLIVGLKRSIYIYMIFYSRVGRETNKHHWVGLSAGFYHGFILKLISVLPKESKVIVQVKVSNTLSTHGM